MQTFEEPHSFLRNESANVTMEASFNHENSSPRISVMPGTFSGAKRTSRTASNSLIKPARELQDSSPQGLCFISHCFFTRLNLKKMGSL